MMCKKCGSVAVATKYIESGACINTSSFVSVRNDFLYSIEYDLFYKVKAHKSHLHNTCNACGYSWRENCKDHAVSS